MQIQRKITCVLAAMAMVAGLWLPTAAQAQDTQFRNLDNRIQQTKKKVLDLNRELFLLEEELLYPGTSQVAVFLSLDVGKFFRLDSVQLRIDDHIVANHLYTQRELGALAQGGVQQIFTGNLKSGKHELVAYFIGKGPKGRDYKRATTRVFAKETDAKYIELKIVDNKGKQQPEFDVREWN